MNLETVQVIVVVALSISTILVTIIGIQLIFLLRDIQKIVKRAEKVSNGFSVMSEMVSRSFSEAEGMVTGVRSVVKFFNTLFKGKKDNDE